jgi:hypothetical protein
MSNVQPCSTDQNLPFRKHRHVLPRGNDENPTPGLGTRHVVWPTGTIGVCIQLRRQTLQAGIDGRADFRGMFA